MNPNFCYQMEFNASATGKKVSMTKRRLRWKFGFPNIEAIQKGESGNACRGEEHEVTVVWSITSGKRMIMCDNAQVFQFTEKTSRFEHSWVLRTHVIKLVAFSNAAVSNHVGQKQYDLFIDDVSFFSLPKIFEIGLKRQQVGMDRNPSMYGGNQYRTMEPTTSSGRYYNVDEGRDNQIIPPDSIEKEKEDLKKAVDASLKESNAYLTSKGKSTVVEPPSQVIPVPRQVDTASPRPSTVPPAKEEVNLIDFFDEPVNSAASVQTNPTYPNAMVPLGVPQSQWSQSHVPPQPSQYPYYPNSAPAPVAGDIFAPKPPTYNDISSQIMQSYSGSVTMSQPGGTPNNMQNQTASAPAVPGQISVVTPGRSGGPTAGVNNQSVNQQAEAAPTQYQGYHH